VSEPATFTSGGQSRLPIRFDPLSYLEHNAARTDLGAAIYDDGQEVSFAELLAVTTAYMAALHELGVRSGHVVAVALPNVWRYVALEIAIPALGAVLLPLPIQFGSREVTVTLQRSGASQLVTDGSSLGKAIARVGDSIDELHAVLDVADLDQHWDGSATLQRPAPDPQRIVQIASTSGTTGLPKLASLSAELKQLTFEGFTSRLGFGPADRVLPMSPITQGVGEMCLYALRTGAGLVMSHHARFDPDRILALAEESRATILAGVPTMIGRLLRSPRLVHTRLDALRGVLSAGAPLAPTLAAAWEQATGSRICSFYGAMDIGQLAVPSLEDPPQKRWTTVGRPHEVAEYLVCDRAGRAVPAGEVGEICMRGPLVQQRYWGEDTGPFAEDGWAHFGDLGFVDAEGYLHITGRHKDIIIRGGNNINPQEVEEVIRRYQGIKDACIVGRPDDELGERAVAFVVCADGAHVQLSSLQRFLEHEGLTRFKWPEEVIAVEEIPLGGTGKVDRAALRERLDQATHTNPTHAERNS
jgi:acyl-CoA synthetase (AMP-forming)/AMP-acid ligase II